MCFGLYAAIERLGESSGITMLSSGEKFDAAETCFEERASSELWNVAADWLFASAPSIFSPRFTERETTKAAPEMTATAASPTPMPVKIAPRGV